MVYISLTASFLASTQHYKLLSWKLELLLFEVRNRGSGDSVADPHVRGRDI